jgi:hypothetical protein
MSFIFIKKPDSVAALQIRLFIITLWCHYSAVIYRT